MMNVLTFPLFTETFPLSGKKMVDRLRVFVLFACLFLGGSGGSPIAIVALVTINEDPDHHISKPLQLLFRFV
jgi:hypothetical protein